MPARHVDTGDLVARRPEVKISEIVLAAVRLSDIGLGLVDMLDDAG